MNQTKKLLSCISLLALLALPALSQTNTPPITNPPVTVQVIGQLETFLSGAGTNLFVVPYGIYSSGEKSAGGGIALAYKLSDYVVPAFRIDYLNKEFYQGSITTQLQLPIKFSLFNLYPFGLAGASVPFSGAGGNNGTVQGVAGLGLAINFNGTGWIARHIDLVGDWEQWSSIRGDQYRFGLVIKF
jgi:hypothetical protein